MVLGSLKINAVNYNAIVVSLQVMGNGLSPEILLKLQFPASGLGKQRSVGQILGPLHLCVKSEKAPDFWLWPGSELTLVAF